MLLSSRCNVFVVDDEGFEEIVFYGFMIKLVFVYLCFKNNLGGFYCDLFDDYDLIWFLLKYLKVNIGIVICIYLCKFVGVLSEEFICVKYIYVYI